MGKGYLLAVSGEHGSTRIPHANPTGVDKKASNRWRHFWREGDIKPRRNPTVQREAKTKAKRVPVSTGALTLGHTQVHKDARRNCSRSIPIFLQGTCCFPSSGFSPSRFVTGTPCYAPLPFPIFGFIYESHHNDSPALGHSSMVFPHSSFYPRGKPRSTPFLVPGFRCHLKHRYWTP